MKSSVKRLTSGLLALIMMFSLVTQAAGADEDPPGDKDAREILDTSLNDGAGEQNGVPQDGAGELDEQNQAVMPVMEEKHAHSLAGTNTCELDQFTEQINFDVPLTAAKLEEYLPANAGDDSWYSLPSGNYYLTEDLDLTKGIQIWSGVVNLCLNGHKINGESDSFNSSNSMIRVAPDASLHICDCNADGKDAIEYAKHTDVLSDGAVNEKQFVYNGDDRYDLTDEEDQLIQQAAEAVYQPSTESEQSGTFEDMWNLAAKNGGTVKLLQDITAVNGSFGAADDGFDETGGIKAETTSPITLDLNGCTLDRQLSEPKANGSVLSISNATEFTLEDSGGTNSGKITGGNTTGSGGGILFTSVGKVTISNGEISNNAAILNGGGISQNGGTFDMQGGRICNNRIAGGNNSTDSDGGAGVYFGVSGTFTMSGGQISNNHIETGHGHGGGICVYLTAKSAKSTVTISGGKISNNSAAYHGGGVCVYDSGSSGYPYVSTAHVSTTISGGEISNNTTGTAYPNGTTGSGGGIYTNKSSFSLTGGVIAGNTAYGNGGGVSLANTFPKGVSIRGGEIRGNSARVWAGGIDLGGKENVPISDVKIIGNTAGKYGGGVYSGLLQANGNRARIAAISGKPEIYGNKAGTEGNWRNSNLDLDHVTEVGSQQVNYLQTVSIQSTLSEDAIIGISVREPKDYDGAGYELLITSNSDNEALGKYVGAIFADDPEGTRIEFKDNNLYLQKGDGVGVHRHPGVSETYQPVGDAAFNSGSIGVEGGLSCYYLTENVALEQSIQILGNVDLCLSGYTITPPENGDPAFVVGSGSTFRICAESAQTVKELLGRGIIKMEQGAHLELIDSKSYDDVDAEKTVQTAATSGEYNVAQNKFVSYAPSEHRHSDGTVFVELPDARDPLAAGNYYLTGDLALTEPIVVSSGTVKICLNGHKITGPGNGQPAFKVSGGATLDLYNDQGDGGFGGLSGSGGVAVDGGGTLNLYQKDGTKLDFYAPALGSGGGTVKVEENGAVDIPGGGGEDPAPDTDHAERHPDLKYAKAINAENFTEVTKEASEANKPTGYTGPLPTELSAYRFLNAGQYYLEDDFKMPYALIVLGETDFCLNGSNLGADNDTWLYEMQHVFWVPEKTALNVLDCQRDLHIVWLYGGRVFLKRGAQVNISGSLPGYITTIEMKDVGDSEGEVGVKYVNEEPVLTLPDGATFTQKVDGTPVQTIRNDGGVLTMITGGTTTTITPPNIPSASIGVKLPADGEKPAAVLEAPAGSTVQTGAGPVITLEQPGEVKAGGTLASPEVIMTHAGTPITITAPEGETVQVDPDGTVKLPADSTVQIGEDGPEIEVKQPGKVNPAGIVTAPEVTVTADSGIHEVITITAPAGQTARVNPDGTAEVPVGSTVTSDGTTVKIEEITPAQTVKVGPEGKIELPKGGKVGISNPKRGSTTIVIALPGSADADGAIDITGGGFKPPKGSDITVKPKKEGVTIVIALPWPEDGGGEPPEIRFTDSGAPILPPGTEVITTDEDGTTTTVADDKNNILDPETGELTDTDPEAPKQPINPNEPTGTPENITTTPIHKGDVEVKKDDTGKIIVTPSDPEKPPLVIAPRPQDPGDPEPNPPQVDDTGKVFLDTPFTVATDEGGAPTTITADEGGSVDPLGNVTGGKVTIEQKDPEDPEKPGSKTILTAPEGDSVKVGPDGGAQVPEKTEVKQNDVTITIDKVPDPTQPVPVRPGGGLDLPGGSEVTVTPDPTKPEDKYTVTLPADKGGEVKTNPDGTISVPEGTVKTPDGREIPVPSGGGKLDPKNNEVIPNNPGGNDPGTNPSPGGNPGDSGGSSGSVASYIITAGAGDGGTIRPAGQISVSAGSSKTFVVAPQIGYDVAEVLVDGVSVGEATTYTFQNIRANHTIQASFVANGGSGLLNTEDHRDYLHGFEDGLFRPDASMTRAEAAQMFYNLLKDQNIQGQNTFTDVPEEMWYFEAVNALETLGVMRGVTNERFEPDRPITRGELVVTAVRFTKHQKGTAVFTDVAETDWYYPEISAAASRGWIDGYEDGTFRPNNYIARAEAAAVINRLLGRQADEDFLKRHPAGLRDFPDVLPSHWGYGDIMEAANAHDYRGESGRERWTALR